MTEEATPQAQAAPPPQAPQQPTVAEVAQQLQQQPPPQAAPPQAAPVQQPPQAAPPQAAPVQQPPQAPQVADGNQGIAATPTPAPAEPPQPAATVQMPGAASQGAVAMPAQPVAAMEVERPKQVPDTWPEQGYTGPQPWEVEEPPQLTHDRGLITSGAAGAAVTELAACLAHLGIGTSISEGTNPHMIYGPTEVAAVTEFRRVFGVEEDPAIVRAGGDSVVGPWTWEALFRAVRKAGG